MFSWNIPKDEGQYNFQLLDEKSFFIHFTKDINAAKNTIFALAPFFGEYRWPKIQPLFNAALKRKVEVTIITPNAVDLSPFVGPFAMAAF